MEAAEEVATEAAVAAADTAEEEVAVVDMEVAAAEEEEATVAVAVAEIAAAEVETGAATVTNKTEWHAHGFAWACDRIS